MAITRWMRTATRTARGWSLFYLLAVSAQPAEGVEASTLARIREFPVPTFDSRPAGITTGPDGNLWFTETTGNNIGRR